MSQEALPKKIYRQVLKGINFYYTEDGGSGCTLNELISYVFLKNNRVYKPPLVKAWVEAALEVFRESDMVQLDGWGNIQLHSLLQQAPEDDDESYKLTPDGTGNQAVASSQETLSNVPHFKRVMQRKGTVAILPKHRVHATGGMAAIPSVTMGATMNREAVEDGASGSKPTVSLPSYPFLNAHSFQKFFNDSSSEDD